MLSLEDQKVDFFDTTLWILKIKKKLKNPSNIWSWVFDVEIQKNTFFV